MKKVKLFINPLSIAALNPQRSIDPSVYKKDSFWKFIYKENIHWRMLWIAVAGMILQFMVFKWLYPFPDFVSDSYAYIYAASAHLDVSSYPIGYSKFLSVFHLLTHSDWALIAFQYFFLEGAALFLFFSFLFFYSPRRLARNILFIFLFFNPLLLYISNYVDSTSIFVAISILWFTQLIWIIRHPSWSQILIQATLLFLCISLRNSAYYYLFITAIAFLLTTFKPWMKAIGIAMPLLLILPFLIHIRTEAKKMTGTAQVTLNRGWQLANNALYMRRLISVDDTKLPSTETRELDGLVKDFYKHIRVENLDGSQAEYSGNLFIEDPRAPLQQYFRAHFTADDTYGSLAAWGKASAVFYQYGSWLISHYPLSFAHYFLLPNMRNYFLLPLEGLGSYNQGEDNISLVVQDWFDYPTPSVSAVSKTLQGNIMLPVSYLFLMMQVFYIGSLIWWLVTKKSGLLHPAFSRPILLGAAFWIANFCYSIFFAPIVMRYQVFPMLFSGVYCLLFIELLDSKEINPGPMANLSYKSYLSITNKTL